MSEDENGKSRRHSQPLHDLKDGVGMHWDGEFGTVRELLTARLSPPRSALDIARTVRNRHFEAALSRGDQPNKSEFDRRMRTLAPPYYEPQQPLTPVPTPLLKRLEGDRRYDEGFKRAFGSRKITLDRVMDALEAYVLSIETSDSAYDKFLAGDPSALTELQRKGLRIFNEKGNCAACHTPAAKDGKRARFTDDQYHNTGVAFRNATMNFNGSADGDGGFGEMSLVSKDLGKFKTPTLRDVARRAPYMHDGSLKTLRDVVDYYDQGGTSNGNLAHHIQPLRLDEGEKAALVAFLEALSGEKRAGLGPMPANRQRAAAITIVDLAGKPLKDFEVEVHPAGDRLVNARSPRKAPQVLKTDARGVLKFTYPAWTHVELKSHGHVIGLKRPLPDYVRSLEMTAVPYDKIMLQVTGPGAAGRMPKRITAYPATGAKKVVAYFRRVRTTKSNVAVYVASKPEGKGWIDVRLDYKPQGINAVRAIDLSGGATAPIDFRQ